MKVLTDKPESLPTAQDFVLMGIVSDSGKDYACLLDIKSAKAGNDRGLAGLPTANCCYIEEIHWGKGKNIHTSSLNQVDNEEEWRQLYLFVSRNTTIFSPVKIREITKKGVYLYNQDYVEKSKDFKERENKGLL